MGTLSYMAPEVLRGQPADARSDVWALGVILYELASGQRPFAGQTPFEISAAILNGPPTALPDSVPRNLRMVIERCLAKSPGERYPHAGELRAALEAIEPGAGTLPATSKTAARSRWSGARLTAAAIVAVALLALLAFDIWGVRRWLASFGTRDEAEIAVPCRSTRCPGPTAPTTYMLLTAFRTRSHRIGTGAGHRARHRQGIDATWRPGQRYPGCAARWRNHGRDGRAGCPVGNQFNFRAGDRCRDREGDMGRHAGQRRERPARRAA